MPRRVLLLLVVFVALGLPVTPAQAAEDANVILVLDRGAKAKATAEGDAGNALRILQRVREAERTAVLMAFGRDEKGAVVTEVVDPTPEALAEIDANEDFAFRGDSDARVALQRALAEQEGDVPIDLILIGPFHVAPSEEEGEDDDPLALIPGTWNETAPADSRILPVGLEDEALAALADARGLVKSGYLVAGSRVLDTKAMPFSPLARPGADPEPLEAEIRLLADVVPLGKTREAEAVVTLATGVNEDTVGTKVVAGLHTFRLSRRQADGRTAAVSFRPAEREDVIWFAGLPKPQTITWETRKPDVILVGPKNEVAPTFAAVDVEAGKPYATSYRIRRSRSGPTPAWRAGEREGTRPAGLSVEIGTEQRIDEDIAESEVRVTFRAAAAMPVSHQGAITLQADGVETTLEIPYEVRVQPGRAQLVLDARLQHLPAAEADTNSTLEVKTTNGNVPATVALVADVPADHAPFLEVLLEAPDGSSRAVTLAEPFEVPVDTRHDIAFRLSPAAPEDLAWPIEVGFKTRAREGLETTGGGAIQVRQRMPRLQQVGETPRYRLEEGKVRGTRTLRLELDPDGGDGAWALALMQTEPVLRIEGNPPIGWKIVGKGAGQWEVIPSGTWTGPEPGIFDPQTVELAITITWDGGQVPPPIPVEIEIAPKWGNKGFILLGFAGAALLLGAIVILQMRPAPVTGTLIYTVDGLEGTVGRLDLSPLGRKGAPIAADERGRLEIGRGREGLFRIQATRVGGMLEQTEPDGSKERRLLVDGLSFRAGKHLIRYVSGEAGETAAPPEPVPDLLGEEFDIASGRIEALGDDDPE